MSTDVEPDDWSALDPWWTAYEKSQSITRSPASPRMFAIENLTQCWSGLDPWWRTYPASSSVAGSSASTRALRGEQLTGFWNGLDPWWDVYVETGHETAVQIADLLEQSNQEWEDSDAPFDTDPLAADLTGKRLSRGPLRPNGEVEWSRWLAQLLRPSAALITELFDVTASQAPSEVIREEQLSKEEGTSRRPDILVFNADQGISVEVKLGDENYQKTAETAALVESHYDNREWNHALLLPSRKKERLSSIVEAPLGRERGNRLTVEWDDPGSIDVLFWCDVTAAIREMLRRDAVVDEHWAANAYLFCAVAEQQLMDFQPQPIVNQLADPTNVVDTIQPIGIADTLEEQLTYLRERVDS